MARLKVPLIVVNYKAYPEAVGAKAVALSRTIEEIAKETGVSIAVAPQVTDLSLVADATSIPLYAQHIDDCEPGAKTGHVTAEALKETGVVGSLINHSERQLKLSAIEWLVKKTRALQLNSIVCANNPEVSVAVTMLNPTAVAIEPPELIGTGTAVSKARPEVVSGAVDLIRKQRNDVAILCGAGIVNGDDVRSAIKLGVDGILVASGVVKARDPRAAVMDLAKALL